jgi:integrase
MEYVFTTFSAVWRLALDYGVATSICPTKRKSFRLPKVSNARKKFLSQEEIDKLFPALEARSPQLRAIVQVSYDCGLRFGEIASLKWGNVDLSGRGIEILNGKGDKDRDVPMTDAVYKMLSEMPEGDSWELVFPGRRGQVMRSVSSTYERTVKELKLNKGVVDPKKKITFHTLRHTYASRLVKAGVDLYRVQKLMGHSSIRQTERYSHLANSDLKDAVRQMESKAHG